MGRVEILIIEVWLLIYGQLNGERGERFDSLVTV